MLQAKFWIWDLNMFRLCDPKDGTLAILLIKGQLRQNNIILIFIQIKHL